MEYVLAIAVLSVLNYVLLTGVTMLLVPDYGAVVPTTPPEGAPWLT